MYLGETYSGDLHTHSTLYTQVHVLRRVLTSRHENVPHFSHASQRRTAKATSLFLFRVPFFECRKREKSRIILHHCINYATNILQRVRALFQWNQLPHCNSNVLLRKECSHLAGEDYYLSFQEDYGANSSGCPHLAYQVHWSMQLRTRTSG